MDGGDLLRAAAGLVGDLRGDEIEAAADVLFASWEAGGVVLSCGNGGSASTASHFAADLGKLTIVGDATRFKTVCLDDNASGVTAWSNDAGFASVYAEQAAAWLDPTATVVAFSVHGGALDGSVSSNLSRVCEAAIRCGSSVIAVTGFDGGFLGRNSTVHVNVPTPQEPLATPLVESLHVLVQHALCLSVRCRILEREAAAT